MNVRRYFNGLTIHLFRGEKLNGYVFSLVFLATMTTLTFPAMFTKKGFFSFYGKFPGDVTSRELKNFILFKGWCKHNNVCFDCTLATPLAPVQMDEDMIPNCPNCDSYYYEEFKEAQQRADAVARGEKVSFIEANWEDVRATDVCEARDDFLLL